MDVGFLAQRPTRSGRLGRPRVKLYPKTVWAVCIISLIRTITGVVVLWIIPDNLDDNATWGKATRSPPLALSALSLLFAVVDWIPYRLYTWQRQPTVLTKWATPVLGAASILANTTCALVLWAAGEPIFVAMMPLGLAICGVMLMNTGLLYFVYYGPLQLPPVYEPVWNYSRQDQENDGSASADPCRGPLARLYQTQMCSKRDTGDGRVDNPQPTSRPALTSQSANTASFSPALIFWQGKKASKFPLTILAFLGLLSTAHIVVQAVRYNIAKRNGESCDSICILHLVYPPLWIFFILAICVLIKTRVHFQKQLPAPMTLSTVLCVTFFAILAIWIVDLVFTRSGTALFEDDDTYQEWMVYNGLILVFLLIIGLKGAFRTHVQA